MSVGTAAPAGPYGSLDDYLRRLFQTLDTNGANLDYSGAWSPVADFLAQDHRGFFDRQEDPNGQPWKPLSAAATDSRWLRDLGGGKVGDGRKGKLVEAAFLAAGFRPDDTILIETGAMKSSVSFRGNRDHVEQAEPLAFVFGTKDPKAETHQYGAINLVYDERRERWKEIEIPPRPFVGWSDRSIDFTVNYVADQTVEMLLAGI